MDRRAVQNRIDPRSILRTEFHEAYKAQTSRYGDHPWTDREFERIDQAVVVVEAAIQANDAPAFRAALLVFVRRTTPIEVLHDALPQGTTTESLNRWVDAFRDMAERFGRPEVLVIDGCTALGGQALTIRILGQLQDGEFDLGDLPALVDAVGDVQKKSGGVEAAMRLLDGIRAIRKAFPGGQVTQWRAA